MTNQIVAAVMKVSSGKATVTCLQMDRQGGYGEVKFWWKGKASNPPSAGSILKNSATEDEFWCNSGSFGVKNFYSLCFFFIFWCSWSILHAVKKRRVKEKR